jgi:hypothetical protein
VELTDLRVGDCFDDRSIGDTLTEAGTDQVNVVPCDEAHDAQVFHAFELSMDDYPTVDVLDREAEACLRAFTEFVGVRYDRSELETAYYYPSIEGWSVSNDRSIVCVAHDRRGGKLEESVEGSRH